MIICSVMLVIPSIYIKDNHVFPLATGGPIFDKNPVEMAKKLAEAGAEVIFISDLNCPPSGHVPHLGIIEEISKQIGLKVSITGNIRSEDVVEKYIGAGVEHVVMGTIAYQKPDFLKNVCEKFPSNIAAHIEVKGGKVSITGWTVATRKTDIDYAEQFRDAGVSLLLYSNLETDGKISLTDINNLSKFLIKSPLPIVQSADINSISEIESILSLSSTKLIGTILGRSMYAGLIDIASTITHSKEKGPSGMDEPTLIP